MIKGKLRLDEFQIQTLGLMQWWITHGPDFANFEFVPCQKFWFKICDPVAKYASYSRGRGRIRLKCASYDKVKQQRQDWLWVMHAQKNYLWSRHFKFLICAKSQNDHHIQKSYMENLGSNWCTDELLMIQTLPISFLRQITVWSSHMKVTRE